MNEKRKITEELHFCLTCKYQTCKPDEEPCKSCNEWPHLGCLTMDSKWEPKEGDPYLCKDCKFAENSMFKEPCCSCFKREGIEALYHMNWQPKVEKDDVVHKDPSMNFGPNMMGSVKIKNNINDIFGIDGIKKKIDELSESLESINAKIVILDKHIDDIREHQIMKGCILDRSDEKLDDMQKDIHRLLSKVDMLDCLVKDSKDEKEPEKDISRPEPKFKVNDEVQVVNDIFRMTYTIERMYWCDGPAYYRGYWYVLRSSSDRIGRHVQEDLLIPFKQENKDISSVKEPPKFKVGDIVKVTNDSRNKDFFVCRIKWSEHSKQWNYLISSDLENNSYAFWRTEKWLTKSEDHSEPLFNVGDKVKLKHGKVVYEVYSITHFMHNKKKIYRYKIGHGASTTHYENENRLIKA